MSSQQCDTLADLILEALELGRPGAVRAVVDDHSRGCATCARRAGTLRSMAAGLDPTPPVTDSGFVAKVLAEIRGVEDDSRSRLPPPWQVLGAIGLLVVLAAGVLSHHTPDADAPWHTKALTGFVDQALGFLGVLSAGLTGVWESVAPGKALPILAVCAALATVLNVAFAVGAWRRRKQTVE